MTINERIKLVRSNAGLTLVEFGKKIGLTKSTVSRMEQIGYSIIPQNIQLICSTYGVAEKWLVTGEGKMYASDEDAILEKVSQMYSLSPEQEIFARHWLQLPPDAREAVVDYVVGVVESIKENSDTTRTGLGQDSDISDTPKDEPPGPSDPETNTPPAAVFKPTAQQVTGTAKATKSPAATAPSPAVSKLSANEPATARPDEPADDGTHAITVSDKELAMVLMLRQEEEKGSSASSTTSAARA